MSTIHIPVVPTPLSRHFIEWFLSASAHDANAAPVSAFIRRALSTKPHGKQHFIVSRTALPVIISYVQLYEFLRDHTAGHA